MKTARERILEFQLHFGKKLSLSEYRVLKLFIEYISQQQELPTEEENKLRFLTWYEQITGETHHDLDLEFDEDMLWHWRTWNEAAKAITNLLKGERCKIKIYKR